MSPANKKITKKLPSKAKVKSTPKAKKPAGKDAKVLMTAAQVKLAIKKLADEIAEEFPSPERLVLLGIRTRGVTLADRLHALLSKKYKKDIALGVLDITFYRDDLSRLGPNPMVHGSELPFDISDTNIVLIDDVLYTGRTVRAAMDEISDFGRPALVRLAIFVDRGLREYPIHPDYCALNAETKHGERISVRFIESDGEDKVLLDELPDEE